MDQTFCELSQWQASIPNGWPEIHQFLSHLAIDGRVAASTQNQALNAIVFLYRKVVKKELGDFSDFPRAHRPKRIPVVLSRQEVQALLSPMDGTEGLLARLIYGTGMRVSEALRLRVQDLAFDRNEITVRAGKGDKDRRVPFPASLKSELQQHLDGRRHQYEEDRKKKMHEVELPGLWPANTLERPTSGNGNLSLPATTTPWIRAPARGAVITCTRFACSVPSNGPLFRPK